MKRKNGAIHETLIKYLSYTPEKKLIKKQLINIKTSGKKVRLSCFIFLKKAKNNKTINETKKIGRTIEL
jgi:hypothetical protein